jgi:uncharacterized protein YbjT (DUF2867 family)
VPFYYKEHLESLIYGKKRKMILVTGASGKTGAELVQRLSGRGVSVRGLVHNIAKADILSNLPNVEIFEGDMLIPRTLEAALQGVDRAMLISSTGPAMFEVQVSFIDAASAAGVKHIVKLSGIMPELDSPFRYARMHGEIERHLERSGVAFTHLRAGEFFPSYFRQVRSIMAKGELILPMEDARIASIDIGDIAEVAATVLTSAGHEGKIYPITGPEALSMAEVAEKLSKVAGKPIRYINVSPEDARKANLSAGMTPYMADGLFELFAERRKGKEAQVSTVIPDVFGWHPTRFDEFAARNGAIFRGEQPAPKI